MDLWLLVQRPLPILFLLFIAAFGRVSKLYERVSSSVATSAASSCFSTIS